MSGETLSRCAAGRHIWSKLLTTILLTVLFDLIAFYYFKSVVKLLIPLIKLCSVQQQRTMPIWTSSGIAISTGMRFLTMPQLRSMTFLRLECHKFTVLDSFETDS